jgi:hypothetical protein
MRHHQSLFIISFFFTLMLPCTAAEQSWKFIKEKDGIKIYTCDDAGKPLKTFKGVTDINAPVDKVLALLEDVNNTSWWDKNLAQIKVLLYEKGKRAQYYMVYKLPWPVINRDLCVDVTIATDKVTGECRIIAVPLPGLVPERNNMVRIKEYRQSWTLIPVGKEKTQVILECYIDPAGSIPEWISNMLMIESPVKSISGVRKQMEGK